ncbi:MAG: response regulator [Myxococcota bacterium]
MTRILVVEDSATQAEELRLILESEGFQVQTANSAESAVERLQDGLFDVVVSDIVMPGRTGYELCRELKSDPRYKDLPVLLLTTLSDPMDIIQGLESGADNFLTKPCEPRNLVGRIRTIVENKRLRVAGKLKVGVEVLFMGRKFIIGSDKEQILDLLVSTFEDTVRTNRELQSSQRELAAAKAKLEDYARQLEHRAKTSEANFRTLVESMDDMIFTLDREQRYTGVFGRWLAKEGHSREQYLGRSARELLGGEAAVVHEAANERALRGERVVYEWSDGANEEVRHFQTALSPLRDETGQVMGLVGVGRELTEQKRLQSHLMVSDRMASVGTLAAGVAHEINNPLASVIANLDLAIGDAHGLAARIGSLGELTDELRDARDAAERVREIVRDLRIFSRAEEDKRGPVDVHRVMESTIRMAWNEIRHRARLVRAYGDVPPVDANDSRLGQVFLNLIINAAQAIGEGHADTNRIVVTTRQDGAGRVLVQVTDSGAGIPPEALRHLFTPFYTTKPASLGTGLGLSICQRIVTGFGGEISVESHMGHGTTFTVALPVATALSEGVPAPAKPLRAIRRGRVLIIDDEPMMGHTIRRTLSPEHDVRVTLGARDALELITKGERFDVILCDLMMPEVTGMDLHAEFLRAAPEQAGRMIFLTGGAFTPRARTFLDQVANQRLEKPFDAQHLRAIVNERVR